MFKTIAIAALVSLVSLGVQAQTKPASPCKGLEQDKCTEVAGCRWRAQQVIGEKNPRTGETFKRSTKAHCRKTPAKRSTAAKQDA
jgi:hypothetical protein